jgi:hypothetical protein
MCSISTIIVSLIELMKLSLSTQQSKTSIVNLHNDSYCKKWEIHWKPALIWNSWTAFLDQDSGHKPWVSSDLKFLSGSLPSFFHSTKYYLWIDLNLFFSAFFVRFIKQELVSMVFCRRFFWGEVKSFSNREYEMSKNSISAVLKNSLDLPRVYLRKEWISFVSPDGAMATEVLFGSE